MQENLKLDYTIQSPQQRAELVKRIVQTTPAEKMTSRYLQILANYMIFAMTKQQKKDKKINTDNRLITINKRETSFEGLISKFENGEDGIYNLITNDKNIILTPKISITQEDLDSIPALAELRQEINKLESRLKTARGKKRYLLQKQLIQMRQDQYVIKMAYKQPITCLNATKSFHNMVFDDKISIENNEIKDKSLFSFTNTKHISALLCNYSRLKEACYGNFHTDGFYLIYDLENLIDKSIKAKYPLYFKILVYKIDGKQNLEIQSLLQQEFDIRYSIEHISFLWRNKIPKIIAEQAQNDYLQWYFTQKEKGTWKRCTRCHQIKLAHNAFFSKNNSSKDGFYSICKECRNKKYHDSKNKKILIIKRIPYKDKNNI